MRGLLEAGAILLTPALAGAVSLEEDTIPSAFITLHLPASEDIATTQQDLVFRLDIHESAQACGYGNVSINGQTLPEGGSGSFTVDDDRVIDATWNLTCVAWNDVPQEQLLSLDVQSVNGQPVEDVGLTLRFQQVAPVWISDVEGSASMTRVHSIEQERPGCDNNGDDEEVDVDAEIAELDYLRWQVAEMTKIIMFKEHRLAQALGHPHPHGPPPMLQHCDSIKCAISALYHKVKDTAYSIYGGDYFPGHYDPRPHGKMSGPRHHKHPHGDGHPHGDARAHGGHSPSPQFGGAHHNHTRNGTHPHPHPPHFAHPPPFCKCGPQFPHPPGPHGGPHGPPPHGPPPPGAFPSHHKHPEGPEHMPEHHEFDHEDPAPPFHHGGHHSDHHAPEPHGDDARPHHPSPSQEGHKKAAGEDKPKHFGEHAHDDPEDVQAGDEEMRKEERPGADKGAPDFPEKPDEAELRRDPYYEENHPPHLRPEDHPHDGPPHNHDGPEDFPPPFDHHDGPPFGHDGPPFEHDGPFGHEGGPPGHHHGGPPHGLILMHVASVAASVILLAIFIRVLHQRCARRNPSRAALSSHHRRQRSYSGAPWYKKIFFGPRYYELLDEEEKEAMLRDCDSDCTSVEGGEDVVARDISNFRTAAEVVGEMAAAEEARMMMPTAPAPPASSYAAAASSASSPAHSRQSSSSAQMAAAAAPLALPITIPHIHHHHHHHDAAAAAMFPPSPHPNHHHDEEILPAYQEAESGDDDDASDVASSLMADGYRPGCSGTYTPSESGGSQGAGDILGDTKN